MDEATVQLLCPECRKLWDVQPAHLPEPKEAYSCPDCNTPRRTSEFMRTDRDLETLKELG